MSGLRLAAPWVSVEQTRFLHEDSAAMCVIILHHSVCSTLFNTSVRTKVLCRPLQQRDNCSEKVRVEPCLENEAIERTLEEPFCFSKRVRFYY